MLEELAEHSQTTEMGAATAQCWDSEIAAHHVETQLVPSAVYSVNHSGTQLWLSCVVQMGRHSGAAQGDKTSVRGRPSAGHAAGEAHAEGVAVASQLFAMDATYRTLCTARGVANKEPGRAGCMVSPPP